MLTEPGSRHPADPPPGPALYRRDEVEWLDRTVALAAAGRHADVDLESLHDFLSSAARCDRRDTAQRVRDLLAALLKWHYLPAERGKPLLLLIWNTRWDLAFDFRESRTLRRHAESEYRDMYQRARIDAAYHTGRDMADFPAACPFTLDEALTAELPDDPTAAE